MENLAWRKASRSSANGGACVELARIPGSRRVAARDSKHPHGPQLSFDEKGWHAFMESLKAGRFDLAE